MRKDEMGGKTIAKFVATKSKRHGYKVRKMIMKQKIPSF